MKYLKKWFLTRHLIQAVDHSNCLRAVRAATHTHQSLITLRSSQQDNLDNRKNNARGEWRKEIVKAPSTRGSCALIISIWTSNGKITHSLEVVKRWKAGVLLTGKPWVLLDGVCENRPWLPRYKKHNWGSALIRDMSKSDFKSQHKLIPTAVLCGENP